MALETGTYVADLNASNPVHTDGLNAADAHLRLIKSVLKNQFPNWTSAALNSTQAAIDAAVAAVGTTGIAMLADAGVFFKTNSTDGFTNPSANEIDVKIAGAVVAQFLNTGLTVPGNLNVTGSVAVTGSSTGPGHKPIGDTSVWWSDTLPTGYGTFAFVNGQAISRTTYAALFAILGTTYGPGDGSTTFNLPDLRDNVPVGKGTMGGTSAVGRITNFVTSTLGNLFGECLHLLTTGEMPSHAHTITEPNGGLGHKHPPATGSNFLTDEAGNQALNSGNVGASGNSQTGYATTGITINANGGGTSHNNVQPSIVCNWIMRIA